MRPAGHRHRGTFFTGNRVISFLGVVARMLTLERQARVGYDIKRRRSCAPRRLVC